MNFAYKVIKRNEHEPTLNVLYIPEDEALSQRFAKVWYNPETVSVMATDALAVHLKELIIQTAPVHAWEHEAATCNCVSSVEGVIELDVDVAVTAEEYAAFHAPVEADGPDTVVEV